ncbi:MAG: membrane protein insertase YidC [Acidobacteria bacterium]|nr:MAG: membrane protein insertase YidC [Acidobacteriota bacterium]REJ98366.1 MAG: membrane protein insertase YidC [Acidobacteriota bacterium]REK17110.1 MAG: membrane protein insertase YidC [Acidobacteriota bacterium]REK43020.1 MAG: membrane protein insertase YidC [Acidobacteriota bacterium]
MSNNDSGQNQQRFLIAAVLSLVVLTAWTYFFAPERPEEQANTNANVENVGQGQTAAPDPTRSPETEQTPEQAAAETPDETPNKQIKIKTPLYEATLDTKGAVATSWVLLLNDSDSNDDRKPLYAQGSTKENKKPLELVRQKGLDQEPRLAPFQLATGDPNTDKFLNERNYSLEGDGGTFELNGEDTKEVKFVLSGSNGVEVTKTFVFRANEYTTDLSVDLKKGGQPVPNAKLLIGPSIGDQGIERYDFYKVEPEGVYNAGGTSTRQYAASIIEEGNTGQFNVEGPVDWAGVGDTYFAMAVIPAKQTPGLELRSEKYDEEVPPFFDGIIAWITRSQSTQVTKHLMTAYVPIPTDGAVNRIYTGTKDYFVLHKYNDKLTETVGRPIDIEDFINYGWFYYVTKPFSVPILYCLTYLYSFTHNYGISIILFTLFFYSLLFPLRWYSSKSFKKAQKNAPKMKELQDKMKEMQKKGIPNDDPKMRQLQMEQLKMTKDALPIGGCLPMIMQFPLLIALYITVSVYLGFRQESFLWLPDLSSGDPYHILEFAFAISMVLTFKFSPTTPAVTPEQQMQQKMMTYLMPIMMLWIMWSAPSGLLLYWFTGNVIMFGQQMLINWMNREDDAAAPMIDNKAKLSTP